MAAVPDRARQAFRILHVGFVVAPVLAGLDKFFDLLVDWDRYLAPVATDLLPVSAHTVMMVVGVVERFARDLQTQERLTRSPAGSRSGSARAGQALLGGRGGSELPPHGSGTCDRMHCHARGGRLCQ
jgi:hypothetical protein